MGIYDRDVNKWHVKTANQEKTFSIYKLQASGFSNFIREGRKLGPVYINNEIYPEDHRENLPPYNPDKPLCFKFEFSDHEHPDEDYLHTLGFYVHFRDQLHYENRMDWFRDDSYLDFSGDMEEYGVHDIGYDPDTEILGFHSYEISHLKEMEVMEKWKQYFIDNDIQCGDIIEFPSEPFNEDTFNA